MSWTGDASIVLSGLSFVIGFAVFCYEYQIWVLVHRYFGLSLSDETVVYKMPTTPLQCVLRVFSSLFLLPGFMIFFPMLIGRLSGGSSQVLGFPVLLAVLFALMSIVTLIFYFVSLVMQARRHEYPL